MKLSELMAHVFWVGHGAMVEAMCQGVTDRCFLFFYYIALDHVREVFFARVVFSLQIVSSLSVEVVH